ncbi:hypothetical protein P7K49_011802 [Saguinus oedipus]|uniref:NR LBD domain-containing protein n=1 Tax=Saguinus oedipus TaxID=9490 RepID=A0ABQ9VRP7_SAGOE|nr:hypothetical protein P7K49_011802 [Saguinus oedipus]
MGEHKSVKTGLIGEAEDGCEGGISEGGISVLRPVWGQLWKLQLLSLLWHSLAGAPTGSQRSMAATNFMQEMRAVGERLLLKLQRLPQAEPVEIVAFSVIVLFTGQSGHSAPLGSPWHLRETTPWC